ncbi:hypothetical protein C4580_06110 [Candidatus Woesearchaeota archaeon]|nr:MAG: hypothetical protein C4580_06110 [Candidatus Woesearchaeota archaeon]
MGNGIIVLLDAIGLAGFFVALVFAVRMHLKMMGLSSTWLLFSWANFFAMLWALATMLQWMGIYPVLLDQVDQFFLASAAGLYVAYAYLLRDGFVKLV